MEATTKTNGATFDVWMRKFSELYAEITDVRITAYLNQAFLDDVSAEDAADFFHAGGA